MPNHFDSIIDITGPKEDIDTLIDDLRHNYDKMVFLVEPLPQIYVELYERFGAYNFPPKEKLFTDPKYLEIPEEIRRDHQNGKLPFGSKEWIQKYAHYQDNMLCYDIRIDRVSDTHAKYIFWTAINPLDPYIGALLHNKYPTLSFEFKGNDEMNPRIDSEWRFKSTDAVDLEYEKIVCELYRGYNRIFFTIIYADSFEVEEIRTEMREHGNSVCGLRRYARYEEAHKAALKRIVDLCCKSFSPYYAQFISVFDVVG
ncbi:hypothetical protein TRFO_30509 [Tritrichomonas foetus]|uniref:Uncharacterized protein n=1 Tax=Tritrichomonas foetus TaxID=1144522 RepID=A0A1J4JUJ9_9EUKA|nr:hypothetical protein TRFO_30509 [Tritrichomonas foetus]|eukprot:OHT02386.1 hypothetical protein TRFO_30509 [Tritrichomonas foetus]